MKQLNGTGIEAVIMSVSPIDLVFIIIYYYLEDHNFQFPDCFSFSFQNQGPYLKMADFHAFFNGTLAKNLKS